MRSVQLITLHGQSNCSPALHPRFAPISPRQTRENSSKTREKPSLCPRPPRPHFDANPKAIHPLHPLPPAKHSSRNFFPSSILVFPSTLPALPSSLCCT